MKTAAFFVSVGLVCLCYLVIAVAVSTAAPAKREDEPAALDVEAMLWALRQRESGDNPAAIGPVGERSAYQFTRTTWGQFTARDFYAATEDPEHAERVARLNLTFIRAQLARRGLPDEPVFIAAAWNRGPWFQLAAVRSDYAREVANLYADRVGSQS